MNSNISLPTEVYSNLSSNILSLIIKKEYKLNKGIVDITVSKEYSNIFKYIVENSNPNKDDISQKSVRDEINKSFISQKYNNHISAEIKYNINKAKNIFKYDKLFKLFNEFKFEDRSASDILRELTHEVNYFRMVDAPIIPTKEIINMVNKLKRSKKIIEVNSGAGLLGEKTGIDSFSGKLFENSNKELAKYISEFKTYLNLIRVEKDINIESIDFTYNSEEEAERIYNLFISEKLKNTVDFKIDYNSFKEVREYDSPYFEIPANIVNLSLLKDINELNLIHEDDYSPFIFLSELQDYLLNIRTISEIYEKQREHNSGNTNISTIVKYINKNIRIFYNDESDFSRKLQIMLSLHFFDFNKICKSLFTNKLKSISDIDNSQDLKYTTYSNNIPKGFPNTDNYTGLVFEQEENYYQISMDEVKSFTSDETEFSNLIAAINDNTTKLPKSDLFGLFKLNTYLEKFSIDFELDDEIDEFDYEWLSTQYSNMSRILILFLKKHTKYISKNVISIPVNESNFSYNDLEQTKRLYYGFVNSIEYNTRVKKGSYINGIEQSFAKNEPGYVISYNPSNQFNIKKIFDISKNIDLLLFGRVESIVRSNFYKQFSYAVLTSKTSKILTPYSQLLEAEHDVLLYVKNRKSKTDIKQFAIDNDFVVLSTNT